MVVTFYLSDLHACGHVRGEILAREVNKNHPNDMIICKSDMLASDFFKSHVMVFQRQHSTIALHKMLAAQERGIKCIYECDDDPFHTPEDFIEPFKFYNQPKVQLNIKAFMQCADAITVSTDALADETAKHTQKPIFVVDNSLDIEMWEPQKRKAEGTTIGWMASGSHTIDAPLVVDAIFEVMSERPETKLHLIGWVGWEQLGDRFKKFGDRVKFEPWVDIYDLPYVMSDIDIGLCPLVDNQFNRCKSNVKWLQYSGIGAATIASDLEPYKAITNGVDGLQVKDDEWHDAILGLVDDLAGRESLAKTALERVYSNYDIQKNARLWMEVFTKVRN